MALLVRLLHVLAAALLSGGAAVVWLQFRTATGESEGHLLSAATGYEWLFWGALGLVAMTGVGNLGSLAPGVPLPDTRWGTVLAGKFVLLLAFVLLSVVRSLVVIRARSVDSADATHTLQTAYGVTTLSLLALLSLGEVLAHG
ncbi:hypothetical protein [Haloarchaeobius sp. DFWS5]|uniref:hypothetical protein n=1 Tax=Haloarchaeobius sp. DFWS5 TaxID=3446114 RepID=UPI003EBE6F2F